MGVFDSVYVPCPHCNKNVEFQSKADFAPSLAAYTLDTAPTHILIDILNEPEYCEACGGWMVLTDPRYPPERPEPPRPSPVVSRVRSPDNPVTHPQGMRWWPNEEPFSLNDILRSDPTDAR